MIEGLTRTGLIVAIGIIIVVLVAQFIANVFNYVDPNAAF